MRRRMSRSRAVSDARMGAIQCFLDSNTIVSPAIRLSAMATVRLLCPLGGRAATALVRTPSVVVEPGRAGPSRAQKSNLGYRRRVTEPREPGVPADQAAPAAPASAGPDAPNAGRIVDGRYRLAEVIGTGGMATVHRALDTRLGRFVAVKLLRREVIADADIAMRFRREALAATVLRHRNIVACLETGTDDGQPYLVMELIEGEDLAARLRRGGRLAAGDVARIGLDVARALGVAHVRGIVHRDVKPGNILLSRDGRAMVTDFGIARLAADAEGAVPGTTLGSVHYFSPEQAKGATTTPASDTYSLGLVLFEALTGRRAWSGDTTAQLAAVRIDAPAPSPRARAPGRAGCPRRDRRSRPRPRSGAPISQRQRDGRRARVVRRCAPILPARPLRPTARCSMRRRVGRAGRRSPRCRGDRRTVAPARCRLRPGPAGRAARLTGHRRSARRPARRGRRRGRGAARRGIARRRYRRPGGRHDDADPDPHAGGDRATDSHRAAHSEADPAPHRRPDGCAADHGAGRPATRVICATRSSGSPAVSARAATSRRVSRRRSGSRSATAGRPCSPSTTSSSSGGTRAC